MAKTKIPGGYISDGAISSAHLHSSHGITTSNIGEGTNLYFTDARVIVSLGSVNAHILPSANETYDLGSTSLRWRDLFLSGDTINLGGTKLSKDSSGNLEIKDSSNNPKKIKVSEIEFNDGTNVRRLKISSGKLKSFDGSDAAVKLDLSSSTTSDISEGSNLYYTNARVGSYLSSNGYATQSTIVAAITDSAPGTLDTLNELAAALGDDANFSTTVTNSIATKLPLAGGTMTGDITLANDKDIHFLKADGTNDGSRITRASGNAVRFKFGGNALIFDSLEDTDFKVYNSVGDTIFLIDSNSTATSSSVNVNGKFKVGGTEVIDNSQNLTNIGTISSGAITSTSSITGTSLDINGNAAVSGYLNFDGGAQSGLIRFNGENAIGYSNEFLYINPGNHFTSGVYINSSLKVDGGLIGSYNEDLQLRTGGTTALTLSNTDSSATFVGTISSGNITSSGDLALEVAGATGEVKFVQGGVFRSSLSYNNASGLMILDNKYSSVDIHAGASGTSSIRGRFNSSGLTVTGTVSATGGNSTNWNTAYGWGNHASQSYATQSYVGTQISNLVDSSPAALNTLNELAAALGDDANFSTTVNANIATKLPLAGGTMTGAINMGSNNLTSVGTISSGAINTTGNVTLGTYSTTNTGTLILTGSTANKQATLNCTNGNLHIDSEDTAGLYLNYFEGTGGIYFGNGASSYRALMNSSGHLNLASTGAAPTGYALSVGTVGVIDTSRNIVSANNTLSGSIKRTAHNVGFLEGSYNNVGGNGAQSNPIYTIGSNYNPASTTLSNMYGIGFCHSGDASFVGLSGGSNGWGQYVASDGDARIFLNAQQGTIQSTGQHYAAGSTVWNAGNDGSGSGLDADLLDGLNSSSFLRSDADDAYDGTLTMNGMQFRSSNVNRNLKIQGTSGGSDVGISGFRTDGTHAFQVYGDGNNYGFLDANWGSWDLKKAKNGQLQIDEGSGLVKVWSAGNDGSGSGLDADLLDGQHGSHYLNYNNLTNIPTNRVLKDSLSANTTSSITTFVSQANMATSSGGQSGLQVYRGTSGQDAFMTFHVSGDYAVYFGLDGGTNKLSTGGWSDGAVSHEIYHAGNKPSLATLGFTGASNANYITNNNQLTNGAGYITASASTLNLSDAIQTNRYENDSGGFMFRWGTNSGTSGIVNFSDTTSDPSTSSVGTNAKGITWGQRSDNNPYYLIYPRYYNNTLSSHTRLVLSWHTGVEIGGSSSYGGTRFFNNSPFTGSEIMSVGKGDNHVRVNNNLYISGTNIAWHAGNDGSGSGLDADLLDGQHGSYYYQASNPSGYLTNSSSNTISYVYRIHASDSTSPDNFGYSNRYQTFNYGVSSSIVGPLITFGGLGSNYPMQLTGNYGGSGTGIKYRTRNGDTGSWNSWYTLWHSGNDGAGSGLDADTVDGIQGASLLRSDTDDTMNGNLTIDSSSAWNAGNGMLNVGGGGDGRLQVRHIWGKASGSAGAEHLWLNYSNSNRHVQIGQSGGGNNLYVADEIYAGGYFSGNIVWNAGNDGSGSGLDADTLDGIQGASLLRSDADDTFSGALTSNARNNGIFGVYDSYKTDHIWSMGTAYKNHASGTNFGNLYGLAYKHTNNSTGGTMAGGHQMVWCNNGTPRAAMGYDRFWHAASGNLWGSSNDGSGSGLDADLLDGYNASSSGSANTIVLRTSHGHIYGQYILGSYFNASSGNSENPTIGQVWTQSTGDNYLRKSTPAHFKSQLGLWHTGNDGSGSGLDADTVDGNQAAAFVRANANSTISNNIVVLNRGEFTCGTSAQNNTGQGSAYNWGYQQPGAWSHPYPDLVFGYHTGMRFGGHTSYGGCRFYADHPFSTTSLLFSVGNGDTHVRATNNIYAYTSDRRLKENFRPIENAVDKVKAIGGFIFDWRKDMMEKHDFTPDQQQDDAGLIAQEVQKVMPAAIKRAPFDHDLTKPNQSKSGEDFLTVQYEKMVPLLVEAIKEQQKQIDELKEKLENK